MASPLTVSSRCPILIGREHDLAVLRSLIERAKSGQGHVALLAGEAGIGKSRLVNEIRTEALAHGFRLLQGNCFPTDHSVPYAPLLDLVRTYVSSHELALSMHEAQLIAQDFFPLLPESRHLFPHIPPAPLLPSLDPEQEKRHRFDILAQFLIGQTQGHPVLCVLEDLHWSDDTSLEFLHYLARRCAGQPFLLLLTYRSDEVRPGLSYLLAQLDREHLAQERSLVVLTRNEVDAMVRAIFALPRSARVELVDPLYALTEGNPFFTEEILKSLLAAGAIYYAAGRWEHKRPGELHIPRSAQDAVQQRANKLSEPASRVLKLAAVIGRRFSFSLLQQLTSYAEQDLLALMQELLAAQLVLEESAEQFAFRHALTRQTIYASLLLRERSMLHRTVAELLERRAGSFPDSSLADLAYHFFEAEVWEKAMAYGQRAAEQAYRLYTPHTAIEQVTRALSAAQQGAIPPPSALYQLRGQAYEILGDFEHALADYETALVVAGATEGWHEQWQALTALGSLWTERNYTQTGDYYRQALALARQMDDAITLAHSLNHLGNWHMNIEQPHEALHYHQGALALFRRADDARGIAQTCDLLGMANTLGGDLLQASASYQQAITLFQQLDDRQGLASSLATLMVIGEGGSYEVETMVPATTSFALSLHFGEQALRIARAIDQPSGEVYALLALAQYLGPHGEYARGLEAARASLALAEQIEHRQWLAAAHWQLGVLLLDLIALPTALQHLEQALALAREVGSWNWIRIVAGFLAPAYLLQNDLARAEAILADALEADAAMQTIGQRLVWAARADLALARATPDLALHIIEGLIASATNLADEYVIPRLWQQRGEALAALQRSAEAETVLQAARKAAREQGLRPLRWRIEVSLGRLYQVQRRKPEAEQAFSAAQALIEELAATVLDDDLREQFLARTARLLPQKRALTPARAAKQASGGLTAREREVAQLIEQGRSNQEIANLLMVGNRTVEAHVSSILSKLGFTSSASS